MRRRITWRRRLFWAAVVLALLVFALAGTIVRAAGRVRRARLAPAT